MERILGFKKQDQLETLKLLRQNDTEMVRVRDNWDDLWREIAEYVLPYREYMEDYEMERDQRGKKHGTNIYDVTGAQALRLLADGLLGYMVSPSLRWFRLRLKNTEIMDLPEVRRWLQDTEEAMYAEFRDSNFYDQMHQYLEDGGSIGTATMFITEDLEENITLFDTRHPIEIYIWQNEKKKVDIVHRKYRMSLRNAEREFGKENLTLEMQNALEKTPHKEFIFYQGIYPNYDRLIDHVDDQNMPWVSFYWPEKGNDLIKVGGYHENPAVVWRWKTNSHEIYGRSPGFDALVEILGTNQMEGDMLDASHLSVRPPMNVPGEMRSRLRLTPNGLNFYEDPSRIITPVQMGINYSVGMDHADRKRQAIRDIFMVDFFLMLSQFEGANKTATEIIELQGEKASVMGSMIGRLNSEALDHILDRVWKIMARAGRTPPVPDVVLEFDDGRYEVEYMGPLAQAQRKFFKSTGIIQSLDVARGIFELNPQSMDWINFDALIKEVYEIYGMPQKVLRDEREVQAIRQAAAQAAEEERQLEKAERVADMIPKGSVAPQSGSPIDALVQAQAATAPGAS